MNWLKWLVWLLIPFHTTGQRWSVGDDLIWTRYLITWQINPKDSWVQEIDNRMTTSLDRRVQTIYHSHLRRAWNSHHEGALGLSASHVQRQFQKAWFEIPELRLFEEWVFRTPVHSQGTFQSRIRLDQRFFLPSEATELSIVHPFQFRFRYQALYRLILPKRLVWRVSNEWMGHTPADFLMDQNRLATSLEIPISAQLGVEAGYIWLLTQGRTQRTSLDVFRLTLHHRIQKKTPGRI